MTIGGYANHQPPIHHRQKPLSKENAMSQELETKMVEMLQILKEKKAKLMARSEALYNGNKEMEPEHLEAIEDSIDREMEMLSGIHRQINLCRKKLITFF